MPGMLFTFRNTLNLSSMYCGTSNIELPVKNKSFYPLEFRHRPRLTYYASLFNSLEVNQTFYKLPKAATLARWVDETPDHFRFTMKLGKEITHNKGLFFEEAAVRRYMTTFDAVGTKKGCLLIQLPGGTKMESFSRLEALLEQINEQNTGWKLAVEFRSAEWYIGEVFELLVSHNALLVEQDMPGSVTPAVIPYADTRYFRFHGTEANYRGSYSLEILKQHALKMKLAIKNGQEVYAYFNNTLGDAVQNAFQLMKV